MHNSNNTCANFSPTLSIKINGISFTYREFGEKKGIPIVLLPHFTAVLDDWDPRIIDGLATEHWVISFDNRGIGGSSGETPSSISEMADDAITFIRGLGLEQVDLLGFSIGGFISQMIAEKEPALVRKLILAGTGVAGRSGMDKALTMFGDFIRGGLTLRHPKYYLFFTHTKNGKKAADAFLKRLNERKEDRVKPTRLKSALAQVKAILGWTMRQSMDLSKMTQPTLVVNGEDDRMLSTRSSFELSHRLPNASLIIYPDAGHGGIFQYHDDFVEKALNFLK